MEFILSTRKTLIFNTKKQTLKSACYLKDFILAVPHGKHVRTHKPLTRTPESCHRLVDHEPLWRVLLILVTFRKRIQPLTCRPSLMFSLLIPPRLPTMAAGVPGVLGVPAPGHVAVEYSLPSVFATTRHHATMVVTAQARGLFTAPAVSRRAHHPVSAHKSLFQPPPPNSQPSEVINHTSFFVSSPSGKSYRQEQCELRNGPQTDPKGVKTFVEWVPKYAGVLPKDVCKLTCRAKGTGYYVVFSQRVRAKKLRSAKKRVGAGRC